VAGQFGAKVKDILSWPGNRLDLIEPKVEPDTYIMVVGGHREFRQWIIPTIPRGRAGVSVGLYGAGTCTGGYSGANGSGAFVWPAGNHSLSGNDYWSGHLGIDIAGALGDGIFAADSGVVVFAGPATGGYGNMVMIDHGNGYQSLYAHMSAVSARCGQSVSQGSYIGAIGSTGRPGATIRDTTGDPYGRDPAAGDDDGACRREVERVALRLDEGARRRLRPEPRAGRPGGEEGEAREQDGGVPARPLDAGEDREDERERAEPDERAVPRERTEAAVVGREPDRQRERGTARRRPPKPLHAGIIGAPPRPSSHTPGAHRHTRILGARCAS
jgi:hypothetical protein